MKKVIVLFVCMLVAFSGFAKTAMTSRDIRLHARNSDQEALRSVLPVRAVLDETTIRLEFFDSPESAVVVITNEEGQKVLTNAYSFPQLVLLQTDKSPGTYEIEIVYGDKCFSGSFIIE